MQVTSLFLLVATTAIATAQPPECSNGQLREANTTLYYSLLEYCNDGEWRKICPRVDSQWDTDMSVAACTELGYSDSEVTTIRTNCFSSPLKVFILSDCKEPGLTNCTVTPSDNCATSCFFVNLRTCNTADCTVGEIRLVGGSTNREGRVEVCVGGRRWRTVCTGSRELAGAVCSQMGYTSEGGTVALTNSFSPGAFPEYRLDCTQLSNGTWHCSPVEERCGSFVELGVVCNKYDITNIRETTQLPATSFTDNVTTCTAGSGVLATLSLAVTAVLVVLQAATMIALISTCVVFKRKLKQKMTMATQQADLTYAVVGGTQTEMKIDPNIAANPAYEAVKCDQEDHTYDVVSEGVASRQRRGD